jgi:putative PEP-CTERM system TPR-repeat lipoprotein
MVDSKKRCVVLRAGLICLLLAAMVGCSGDKSAEQFLGKARQQYETGDKKAAVIELKNALQRKPDYSDARLLLGKIYNEQGNGPSAEKELRRALELGAAKDIALPQLGRALLLQREFQKVLDEVPAPVAAKSKDAAATFVVRGDAFAGLKKADEAQAAYEEARKLDPASSEAYAGLAMLAAYHQHPEEAMRLVNEATQKAPRNASLWMLKARLLRGQGKAEEADQAYQQALKIDPDNVGAHLSLALANLAKRQFDAARKEAEAARKVDPNGLPVRLVEAQIDFQEGKFSAARDNLQEILKLAPNHAPSMLLMGATQLALKSYEQAEAYLSAFLKVAPNHAYARRLLAVTYLRMNQPAKAVDTLQPVLSQGNPSAEVLAVAGEAHMQLREFAKATEYFEQASKASPESAAVRTELALSRVASGDVAQGTAELEAAAAQAGSPVQTDVLLVYTLLSGRQFDKALRAIDALDKKAPNSPLTYNLRGSAYLGKQDTANARKAFEKALSIQPDFFPAAFNLAKLDLRDKNPLAARKRFEAVLAADRANTRAMVALASLERDAGHEKESIDWLEKASKADAKAIQPRALLVQYYLGKKDPQRALYIAREAQTANPNNAEALDLLGSAQLGAGEKDNAVATFGQLVGLVPQSAPAYFQLASAQAATKDLEAARKSLNKALDLKPDFVDAAVALAGLDVQAGQVNEAIKLAQRVQQQEPKALVGYVLEGDIHASQKEFAKATELYQKAFDLSQSGPILVKLHAAEAAGGKAAVGDAKVAQWLKQHPDDLAVRAYLADYLMKQGKDKDAIPHYQAMLQKSPENLVALNNLAWILQKQGDPQAVNYAERAYKLRPQDPAIMDTLGWILVQQGKSTRGLDLLQSALAKAPDAADIRYHVAVGLYRTGDRARARDELERLLKSGLKFSQEHEAQALLEQLKSN